jgi:hypothetical protein
LLSVSVPENIRTFAPEEQVDPERGGMGTRGIVVRDPYASRSLNGEKPWEIRGPATQIRGAIAIISSGTGHAFGVVDLTDVIGL